MRFQRKLAGFPKAVPARTKQPAAIPALKKRAAAAVAAATVAQPVKQSLPSCILCGTGLLAVAAYVHPSETESPSQGAVVEMQTHGRQNGVATAKTNEPWTPKEKGSRTLNGPVSSASKSMQGKGLGSCSDGPKTLAAMLYVDGAGLMLPRYKACMGRLNHALSCCWQISCC